MNKFIEYPTIYFVKKRYNKRRIDSTIECGRVLLYPLKPSLLHKADSCLGSYDSNTNFRDGDIMGWADWFSETTKNKKCLR